MNPKIQKRLFFYMTRDFLEVYIPQDSDSKKTVKAYRDGLTVFRRYVLEIKGLKMTSFTFDHCTFEFILDYRNWLLNDQKKSRATVNNRLAAIKSYLHYAAAKDVSLQQIQFSIASVPFLKVPKPIRPIIEEQNTLRALLDAPPNTKLGCRDTMIMSILFDTMIRADELIKLSLKDVQLNPDNSYIFIHGKGNKERTAPLSIETIPLINAYMDEFHNENLNTDEPFIYTVTHGIRSRMSERNIERIVKKYADIVRREHPDLPASVYPHMFRRTRGTCLYRDGVEIEAIATAMGHASIQTTKDHYAFPSLEQKREAMRKGTNVLGEQNDIQVWPDEEEEMAKLCGLR